MSQKLREYNQSESEWKHMNKSYDKKSERTFLREWEKIKSAKVKEKYINCNLPKESNILLRKYK